LVRLLSALALIAVGSTARVVARPQSAPSAASTSSESAGMPAARAFFEQGQAAINDGRNYPKDPQYAGWKPTCFPVPRYGRS
jgi:hypothetical protein